MTVNVMIQYAIAVITTSIHIISLILALLLILRSFFSQCTSFSVQTRVLWLFVATEVFVISVRYILPEITYTREVDYSPLVAAIIILLLGLGMEELVQGIPLL